MGELDDVLKALADEREQSLQQIAEDLGVDWDEIKAVGDAWGAAQAERDAEAARMSAYVDSQIPRVTAELTRDFLRPALLAAGFDSDVAERYEVTYESAAFCGGFNPDMFAQAGDCNADCAGAHWDCQPWPKVEEE